MAKNLTKTKKLLTCVPEQSEILDQWHHPLTKKQGLSLKGVSKLNLIRMLKKSIEESRVEDSLKYAVEMHCSGFGAPMVQTLIDVLLRHSGSPELYSLFRKRLLAWEISGRKKVGVNCYQTRLMLGEMVGLLCRIKRPNILVEPRVKIGQFGIKAPSLDWVAHCLALRGAELKDFPKELMMAWNEVLWSASEWTPEAGRRENFEMASHCFHAWTYCLKLLAKTNDKNQIREWVSWIWEGLGEFGPWKKLKTWALMKPNNIKWNNQCLLRGWFMDPREKYEVDQELRLKIAIQLPLIYQEIINHCLRTQKTEFGSDSGGDSDG